MEGVEVQDHVVVVVDVAPVGYGRADGGRIAIVGDDAEVNRVRRVPDQDLGLLLRGPAIHRLVLPEAGEPGGLGPGRLVELPVDLDRSLQTGNLRCRGSPPLDRGTSPAQAINPMLRARTLELVDHGRVRSRLSVESDGEVVFRLFDQSGTIRVKLGANESGSGLVLADETTEPGVHIVARRAAIPGRPKTTSITLTGAGGRQRVITP